MIQKIIVSTMQSYNNSNIYTNPTTKNDSRGIQYIIMYSSIFILCVVYIALFFILKKNKSLAKKHMFQLYMDEFTVKSRSMIR